MKNCDVFKVDTEIREGKHYSIVSYPNGSTDISGPFDTPLEAELKCVDALRVLTEHFGDRIKKVEWEEQGTS